MRRMACLSLLTSAAVVALVMLPCHGASAIELAAHKAEYKLTMEKERGGDIASGTGSMTYEVIDACDGWAVRQRLKMVLTNRDGQDITMLSDYNTFESKDGLSMRFRMHQTTDDAVTSDIAGEAKLDHKGGTGTVSYTAPEPTTMALPEGTLFPTAHTEAIIAAAQAGRKFIALPLFDGSSQGGAQDSSVVLSPWASAPNEAAISKIAKNPGSPIAALPSGHVHIAFFDHDPNTGQQPDYEVGMRYWANGIADGLSMDFGDFVMSGTLSSLTVPKPGC